MKVLLCFVMLLATVFPLDAAGSNSTAMENLPSYASVTEGKSGSVPFADFAWAFFGLVSGLEENEPLRGLQLLSDGIGLPDSEAQALYQHIRQSVDQIRQANAIDVQERCSSERRSQSSSRQQIAADMIEADRRLSLRREELVSQMQQFVSPDSHARIVDWISEHIAPGYVAVSFDCAQFAESTDFEPAEFFAKKCGESPKYFRLRGRFLSAKGG